jgi:hypothetical protein
MPARADDPSLDAMLRELETTDPIWTRVREKLGEPPPEKGTKAMVDGTNLTPDALLYYCEARLDGLDTQMQGIMDQQETSNADEQHLKDAIDALDQYSSGGGDPQALIQTIQGDVSQIQDPATQAKMQDLVNDMQNNLKSFSVSQQNAPEYLPFTSSQIQAWTDTVKNVDSDLSSGAELNMIQLQSLMSERQVATQLTTNLVQSLGDELNKIVDNVGRA